MKKIPTLSIFKVNLLIHKGEPPQIYTKLIKWLLTSGRYIVVFVEIIVVAAFIYRYKLDTDLSDLNEKIQEQVPYIQSLKSDEDLIRLTQFQLASIRQIKDDNPDFAQAITKIAAITPQNIRLTTLNFDRTQSYPETNMVISGLTPSNIELSAFISALKKDPAFSKITLTNISLEGQTSFTITGSLSGSGLKKT